MEGHFGGITSLAVTPDARRCVCGSDDGTLRVWDIETGIYLTVQGGFKSPIGSLVVSNDRRCISASNDISLRVWDIATGKCERVLEGHTGPIKALFINSDGTQCISGSSDETIRIWDIEQEECLKVLEGFIGGFDTLCIIPDKKQCVGSSWDNSLRVWDIESGQCLRILEGHRGMILSLATTPDGKLCVSGATDRTIRVWNLETGLCLMTLEGHIGPVTSLKIIRKGTRCISGSSDNTLRIWDIDTGVCLKTLEGYSNYINTIFVTDYGKRCISGSYDGNLFIWDIDSGASIKKVLNSYEGRINALAITPDGKTCVSGSDDTAIRVWDLETGECLKVLEGHLSPIRALQVIHNGATCISGSDESTLKVWDLRSGVLLRNLEAPDSNMGYFRLQELTLKKHPILGDIHLDFQHGDQMYAGVYTSVVIGANGIGKSYLLRVISEIFCLLEALMRGNTTTVLRYYFKIAYISHWERMVFSNFRDGILPDRGNKRFTQYICQKEGNECGFHRMILPRRLVATATTISDKFVAKSSELYHYKGLRSEKNPSVSGTRTMVRKTVDSLLGSLDMKYGFKRELCELLDHLGLEPRLELTYKIKNKQLLIKENLTESDFGDYFKKRKASLWGTQTFERIMTEEKWKLKVLSDFYGRLSHRGVTDKTKLLKYDLLRDDSIIVEDRQALVILSSLDLLSYPTLKVYKNEDSFEFEQSSSGELSLFCQMVNIMCDIEPNSLVLIDEPENSAHPNWQINYIRWLKTFFHKYANCHFVISTHSHFLLSDLAPETSDIIALERSSNGCIQNVADGINTFNWSVDDILYRVFHVRNTRNYVFESQMMELYRLMSDGDTDKKKLLELIKELSRYKLNKEDPLNTLLNSAYAYVESI